MKPLAYIRMVLWSFFGIRRRASAGEELTSAKPVVVVATAIGLAALFVVALMTLVQVAITHVR